MLWWFLCAPFSLSIIIVVAAMHGIDWQSLFAGVASSRFTCKSTRRWCNFSLFLFARGFWRWESWWCCIWNWWLWTPNWKLRSRFPLQGEFFSTLALFLLIWFVFYANAFDYAEQASSYRLVFNCLYTHNYIHRTTLLVKLIGLLFVITLLNSCIWGILPSILSL